jgi:hypothetical protein
MAENNTKAAKKKRGPGRPFQPGQSGNPGGRAKKTEELAASIREMDEELKARLVRTARGKSAKESTAAIKLLWGYGHGMPRQVLTDEDGNAVKLGVLVLPPEEDAG